MPVCTRRIEWLISLVLLVLSLLPAESGPSAFHGPYLGLWHRPKSSPGPQTPSLSHMPPLPEASPSSLGISPRNRTVQSVACGSHRPLQF